MAGIAKRDFEVLDVAGKQYLEWKVDVMAHLRAKGLVHTLTEEKPADEQEKAKANVFIRHHLQESLKREYLLVEDPKELWMKLEERYGSLSKVLLPRTQYEWSNLRFQDFTSVNEYNSAINRITSQLKLCGEAKSDSDMVEKTISTMHPTNFTLTEQYRQSGYKYSQLIVNLMVAEENRQLLQRNHDDRPVGAAPFPPQAHAVQKNGFTPQRGQNQAYGRGQGNRPYTGPKYNKQQFKGKGQQQGKSQQQGKGQQKGKKPTGKPKGECFKCGIKGHYANECRTAKHLVELYQASKGKGKMAEANFVDDTAALPLQIANFSVNDNEDDFSPIN